MEAGGAISRRRREICYDPQHLDKIEESLTVGVAQLVVRQIVVLDVVGSNPTAHPIRSISYRTGLRHHGTDCYSTAIVIAPATISSPPTVLPTVRPSPKNKAPNTITSATLSLSIGATREAGPIWRAWK